MERDNFLVAGARRTHRPSRERLHRTHSREVADDSDSSIDDMPRMEDLDTFDAELGRQSVGSDRSDFSNASAKSFPRTKRNRRQRSRSKPHGPGYQSEEPAISGRRQMRREMKDMISRCPKGGVGGRQLEEAEVCARCQRMSGVLVQKRSNVGRAPLLKAHAPKPRARVSTSGHRMVREQRGEPQGHHPPQGFPPQGSPGYLMEQGHHSHHYHVPYQLPQNAMGQAPSVTAPAQPGDNLASGLRQYLLPFAIGCLCSCIGATYLAVLIFAAAKG